MSKTYEVTASASKAETEIILCEAIGRAGVPASRFLADLKKIPSAHRLLLRIHSPGGSVLDGNAIFNAIKSHPGGVTTQIDGLAASMAAVLAIAGSPARMASNGLLMIHNVSACAEGDAAEMRRAAALTDKVQETIIAALTARARQPRAKIIEMMDAETWLDATEAKALGFIDQITGEQKLAASFDLSRFSHPPAPAAFHNIVAAFQRHRDHGESIASQYLAIKNPDARFAFFQKHKHQLYVHCSKP